MTGTWQPNIYVFASLSAVIFGLAIAAFVWAKAPNVPAAKPFIALCALASLWCLFPTVSSLPFSSETTLTLARLTYIPGAFAVASYLHLGFAISEDERIRLQRLALTCGYATATMFTLLLWSPLFIADLIRFGPHFAAVGGPIYHGFVGFYLLSSGGALIVTVQNFSHASANKRNRLRYFLIASALLALSPLLHFGGFYFKKEPFPHDFIMPVFVLIMTYAIMKHRLLDVRLVLRRSLVYSLLIACITAVYLVMVLVTERLFQGFFGYRSIVATLVVAFLIAVFFNPLRDRIQAFVDRALFSATPAELADQREQLLEEVRKGEQMKAVGTLAAGLAHEVKNPLAAIKTFTEALGTKYDDPAFRAKFQKIVGGEVERINLIVHQLLEFAKPIPPKLTPLQVPKLLDETLELLNSELLAHQVQVTKYFSASPPVLGDPQQLKQVFLNLILNSLQAMNGNGRLTLTTQPKQGELLISLEDTGCGIVPEHLARLGEPFFSTKPTGTGLGLAVVRSILKEHQGSMRITSRVGQGTRVEMQIPLAG